MKDKKVEIYVCSDVHSKFDELITQAIEKGWKPKDKNTLLVLAGDIIEATLPLKEIEGLAIRIHNFIQENKNVVWLKGNHEDRVKSASEILKQILEPLPIIFKSKDLFICHGWFNPNWTIKEHQNKIKPNVKFGMSGTILEGAPQNIIMWETYDDDYFGYRSLKEYEERLIEKFPHHTFIFGHYFTFLWDYEPAIRLNYYTTTEEIKKAQEGKQSIIADALEKYNFDKPYISPLGKIRCIDVFTKSFLFDLPYHIYVYKIFFNGEYELSNAEGEWTKGNVN